MNNAQESRERLTVIELVKRTFGLRVAVEAWKKLDDPRTPLLLPEASLVHEFTLPLYTESIWNAPAAEQKLRNPFKNKGGRIDIAETVVSAATGLATSLITHNTEVGMATGLGTKVVFNAASHMLSRRLLKNN